MRNNRTQISQKNLIVIIISFITLALAATLMLYFCIKVMNGLRGYLIAEARWSKAQKTATHEMIHYGTSEEESNWSEFSNNLEILKGSKNARLALLSEDPDFDTAYESYKRGGVSVDLIDDMNWLFRIVHHTEFFEEALEYWEQGDAYVLELEELSEEVHKRIEEGSMDESTWHAYLDDLYIIDSHLSQYTGEFADAIEAATSKGRRYIFLINLIVGVGLIGAAGVVTVTLVRKTNNLNAHLADTKEKFSLVLDNSRDIIYQMDAESKNFEYVSPVVEKILGYKAEELMEEGPEFILQKVHHEDLERIRNAREQVAYRVPEEDVEMDTEYRLQTKSGEYIWVNNRRSVITDESGQYVGVVGNVRDITDRKSYMEQLDRSLEEKDTLLAEIHHRVKNNLAIVSSLIEMHNNEHDPAIQETLKELQSRIKSIALVHEKLYQSDSFGGIDLAEYINGLVDLVTKSMKNQDKEISIEREFHSIRFGLTHAVTFGLICNELISNAFKHAFNDQKEGVIRLVLRKEGDKGIFSVMDNGTGLPEDFDIKNQGTLGMTLVDNLARQLKGELSINSGDWTEFKVSFQVEE